MTALSWMFLPGFLAPFNNIAIGSVDFEFVFHMIVDNLSLVAGLAVIVVKFDADVLVGSSGNFRESGTFRILYGYVCAVPELLAAGAAVVPEPSSAGAAASSAAVPDCAESSACGVVVVEVDCWLW